MVKVYMVVSKDGRALYRDEEQYLGMFASVYEAACQLGHTVLAKCNIRTA